MSVKFTLKHPAKSTARKCAGAPVAETDDSVKFTLKHPAESTAGEIFMMALTGTNGTNPRARVGDAGKTLMDLYGRAYAPGATVADVAAWGAAVRVAMESAVPMARELQAWRARSKKANAAKHAGMRSDAQVLRLVETYGTDDGDRVSAREMKRRLDALGITVGLERLTRLMGRQRKHG